MAGWSTVRDLSMKMQVGLPLVGLAAMAGSVVAKAADSSVVATSSFNPTGTREGAILGRVLPPPEALFALTNGPIAEVNGAKHYRALDGTGVYISAQFKTVKVGPSLEAVMNPAFDNGTEVTQTEFLQTYGFPTNVVRAKGSGQFLIFTEDDVMGRSLVCGDSTGINGFTTGNLPRTKEAQNGYRFNAMACDSALPRAPESNPAGHTL